MGKKQHQSDKLYLTATEWSSFYGGKKTVRDGVSLEYRRLPFDHCALSLQPFETPYSDENGNVFDLSFIVPFIKKFARNPVTGQALESKNLFKLNMAKNSLGQIHCPVLFKTFNNNSHIVAIKTTGHVFSYEAVEELNIKTKNWKDLLDDSPFTKSDIIVLQDPKNISKFNLANYYHIKHGVKVIGDDERAAKDPKARIRTLNIETKETLEELDKNSKSKSLTKKTEDVQETERKAYGFNAAHYSNGSVAASFTSTAMEVFTVSVPALLEDDVVRYALVKKKGYVRLVTNFGNINLELHCDHVQKTTENFIKLCLNNYYDKSLFHRSIRHFMIQGGAPREGKKEEESYWGKPFKDEFKSFYSHSGRGVLSMANSGPNTNKSQFFITYRSCKHLDNKHTVFGRVVGGLETLANFERVNTDNKDKPIEDIIIERAIVFVDPFSEVDEILASKREEEDTKNKEKEENIKKKEKERQVYGTGIGKFIAPSFKKEGRHYESSQPYSSEIQKKKRKSCSSSSAFTNFSSW